MKKILIMSLLSLALFSCKRDAIKKEERCSYNEDFQSKMKKDPEFAKGYANLIRKVNVELENRARDRFDFRTSVVTIPVVVHVVYKNSTENISDAQIQTQIDALNRDFRRLSSELASGPSVFTGIASDTKYEFVLAKRDPSCNSTNGITRTSTTVASFGHSSTATTATARNPVKFASSGGHDAWPNDKYFNIWVCDLSGSLLGYGAWPSEVTTKPAEDGLVVDYKAFGTTGTLFASYNLGRTSTHEIGHVFDLKHIWGDDGGACTGSDGIADTPNQGAENYGVPTFPHVSCSNGPNGDMFMNFMDYTDDAGMYMFTNNQADRIDAIFWTTRAPLAGSLGALPPPSSPSAELFMKDTDADEGIEPNNQSSIFYLSDDIWVRNTNDGVTNQEHKNPNGGATNYVYVRVRNKGCMASAPSNVKLYWAKASSGLSWPSPWNGYMMGSLQMGNLIGTKAVSSVPGNGFTILEFSWVAPDPSDYSVFGDDKAHFCLLARIETSTSAPYGMAFPETSDLHANVKNNNNIAWKNISVIDSDGDGRTSVLLSNYSGKDQNYIIKIRPLYRNQEKEEGLLFLDPKSTAIRFLLENHSLDNLQRTDYGYQIPSKGFVLKKIFLPKDKFYSLIFKVKPTKKEKFLRGVHEFVVEQYDEQGKLIGGQLLKLKYNFTRR